MAKVTKEHGFTLVDALISLVVLASTSLVIQLVIQTNRHIKPMTLSTCANWYLFVAELESHKHQFELQDVANQRLFLVNRANHKKYSLCENHTIYLRGEKGGYLPVLTDYEQHSLQMQQLDNKRVLVSAKTTDGKRHYAKVCFLQKKRQRVVDSHFTNEHFDQHHSY